MASTPSAAEEVRLGLGYAELALLNGEAVDATAQASTHLAGAEELGAADLVARGNLVLARCLEATGRLDEAIPRFEAALAEASGTASLVVATALSRCHRTVGDLARAVEVGDRMRERIAAEDLGRTDESIQLSMTVVMAHVERGDLDIAARLCAEAVAVAESTRSPVARGSAYWNTSVVHSQRGEVESAIDHAQRALALLGETADARNLARLRLEVGRLHLHLPEPRPEEAVRHVERARTELAGSQASTGEIAHADTVLAGAVLMTGDPERAVLLAEAAVAGASPEAPLEVAEAHLAHGRALAALGDEGAARSAFGRVVALLHEVDQRNRFVAQDWVELAAQFEALGDLPAAVHALRQACLASGLQPSPHGQAVERGARRAP